MQAGEWDWQQGRAIGRGKSCRIPVKEGKKFPGSFKT